MDILAIGGSLHDYSFCYLKDGKIIRAIEEERLSKEKYATGMRSRLFQGMDYCIEGLISIKELDMIITNGICDISSIKDRDYVHDVVIINHHMAHICSSYYSSGFDDAVFVVVDGNGNVYSQFNETSQTEILSTGYANRNKISFYETKYGPFKGGFETPSIGSFYLALTLACGFANYCEGKTMGLSSYGKPIYVEQLMENIDYEKHMFINDKTYQVMQNIIEANKSNDIFQTRADLAASGQFVLEVVMYRLLNELYEKSQCPRLCLAGGVALNSVMNGKIKANTPFKEVFIFPAANDGGTAVGAAYYAYYQIGKHNYCDTEKIKHVFFGKSYSEQIIQQSIKKYDNKISYKIYNDKEIINITAQLIADNKIVGWFQDGAETGPRALGNRSIITNPSNPNMKDILNNKVKFRESFRPFAPAVLKEKAHEYFSADFPDNPFMLYVCDVKKDKVAEIPAVVHVDGTARFQTVSVENNKKFYELINAFFHITGTPVVLNTSFNIKGQPIVETPKDAIDCLLNSQMDYVVIHNYLIFK